MKILILSNDHLYANLALKPFFEKYHHDVVGLILPNFIIPGMSAFGSIRFLLKKSFFRFVFYKWFESKVYSFKLALGLGKLKPFADYAQKFNFPIFKTTSINNQKTVDLIGKLKPDVIYSLAYPQKIGGEVLVIPKKGSVNFHDSLLPKYRGLCAYFWITASNESRGGVTATYIDPELDTGKIVLQKEYVIGNDDSMQQVYFKNAKLMGEMILEIQAKLKQGEIKAYPQSQEGTSYYSWPDRNGYELFKKNKKKFFKFWQLWLSI